MTEWWTYRLSDFLLFSPKTYYRLFEMYHRELWPAQILAVAAGVVILIRPRGRVAAALLAAAWIWVAFAFHLQRYQTINWAAKWFAVAFVVEAVVLVIRPASPALAAEGGGPTRIGIAIFAFALFVYPIVGIVLGRSWRAIELFAFTPDPTALGTIGALLFLGNRRRWWLFVIPAVWCVISAATFWAMAGKA